MKSYWPTLHIPTFSRNISCYWLFFAGDICPEGYFCEGQTHTPEPCGNGTYMNHTGGEACYICPLGHYCVLRDTALPCRVGHYCPEGTGADLQDCPAGTYASTEGLGREADCMQCTGT